MYSSDKNINDQYIAIEKKIFPKIIFELCNKKISTDFFGNEKYEPQIYHCRQLKETLFNSIHGRDENNEWTWAYHIKEIANKNLIPLRDIYDSIDFATMKLPTLKKIPIPK